MGHSVIGSIWRYCHNKKHLKMLGPFATANRRTPIHQVSLLSHPVARRLRIDVHNNDDNDNA